MSQLRVGTSGWTYAQWRGMFYPTDVPKRKWLSWYAQQFNSTEINGSFYRTPSLVAVKSWRDQTPDDFVFAWKASKFITHWKRLSSACRNSLDLMETRLAKLEPKVGPILFQLPPQFKIDESRLAAFLKMLKKRRIYTFEFRHPSWYVPAIFRILKDQNMALCFSDHHDAPAPWEMTASFLYVRGHGPTGKYRGRYSTNALSEWARKMRSWLKKKRDVYCYFDNDQKSAAPKDARRLISFLSGRK